MELIPILSLIILVATISTFILAVGAYILYKIRERKGRVGVAEQPASIGAELVTPSRVVSETRETRRTQRTGTGKQIYTRGEKSNSTRYTEPVTRNTFEGERYTSSQKFKRYTQSPQKETKTEREESLKWR